MKSINDIIGNHVYIIAEISANHAGKIENALKIVNEAKKAGADCIKIQTYTADTLTLDCDKPEFICHGGLWDGYKLYDLYKKASTPWEWQKEIMTECQKVGIDFFSTPFDTSSVDFLEQIGVEFYKIASYELVDIPLIEYVASKKKPMIISTGMGSKEEIQEAIDACHKAGNYEIILLKCTSEYPAQKEDMNISLIRKMQEDFGVPVGLSDHSLGYQIPLLAVAAGAKVIEKHVIMHKSDGGPDADFSMEMKEFAEMIRLVRETEKIVGDGTYNLTDLEEEGKKSRRSLYVTKPIKKGQIFTQENIRSVRPALGLSPKYLNDVIGRKAKRDIEFGEALKWEMIE